MKRGKVTLYVSTAEDDECALNYHSCHDNADCINTKDSYKCKCKEGYVGDGQSCFG